MGAIIPFVLRVGVVGHRDPADTGTVNSMTTDALSQVMHIVEDILTPDGQTPLRIRVVSSLAEGADRDVVNAVQHAVQNQNRWSFELAAIIPYNIDYYREHDCQTDDSREQFDAMLGLDPTPLVLQGGIPAKAQQDRCYRDAGRYVANRCDILVALWDGTKSETVAGTAATIDYAFDQGTPLLWIPTTRTSGSPATPPPGIDSIESTLILRSDRDDPNKWGHYPLGTAETKVLGHEFVKYFAKVRRRSDFIERLHRLEEYNRYSLRSLETTVRTGEEVPKRTAGEAASDDSPIDETIREWIVPKRVVAGRLARLYQQRFRFLDVAVYALTVVAVTLGATSLVVESWAPIALEAIVLLVLLGVLMLGLRRKCHDRWVGFRAMAEYFHIGQYMCFVVSNDQSAHTDSLPLGAGGSLQARIVPWFAPVVADVWDQRPRPHFSANDFSRVRSLILTGWILQQEHWHNERRRVHERWHRFYQVSIVTIFATSVGLVLLHAALSIHSWAIDPHSSHGDVFGASVAIAVIALASSGGALNSIAAHADHRSHAERYRELAYELKQEGKKIHAAETFDDLRRQLLTVRRAMLAETSEWFDDMTAADIEVPT
jgi:hypothetical protein